MHQMMKRDEKTKPKNSSMVKDQEELKEHARVMEKMATNEEIKERGKQPDPIQHDHRK